MPKPQTIKIQVTITEHAFDRAKERLGLNEAAFKKIVLRAWLDGIKHKDTKGTLNQYITKLYMRYKNANNIRIYGEVVYVFSNQTLITVYQVPSELKKFLNPKKTKR